MVLGELGDMHEPFDTGKYLDKRTERHDLRDTAVDHIHLGVGVDHLLPWVGLRLFQTEGDSLPIAIDVEDFDLDLLTDFENL